MVVTDSFTLGTETLEAMVDWYRQGIKIAFQKLGIGWDHSFSEMTQVPYETPKRDYDPGTPATNAADTPTPPAYPSTNDIWDTHDKRHATENYSFEDNKYYRPRGSWPLAYR